MKQPTLSLALLLALPAAVHGQRKASDLYDVRIQQIRDSIYVAYRPEPLRHFVEGNVTIILNEHDVVVVDAGGSPTSARNVIAEVRKLTPNPVRYVINTHDHVDHTLGNEEWSKAFPGVEIVSHPVTRERLLTDGAQYVAGIAKSIDDQVKKTEEKIARLRAEGLPGNEKVIAYMERYIYHDILVRQEEYRKAAITAATTTYEGKLVLLRGARTIEVMFLGHGDTAGDTVVHLPQDKVVCSGDMVVHPIPYGFSNEPFEWLATLGKLSALDFELLVPGHGDVQRGKAYVGKLMRLLEAVQTQVKAAVDEGLDLEATRKRVDLSAFAADFTQGDPVYEYRFRGWFLDAAVGEAFAAVKRTQAATAR
jgi:glyoxylase-like metal-dependent hydrolase (beta-lactamase superfamily II)